MAGGQGNQENEGSQGGGVRKLHKTDSFFFPIPLLLVPLPAKYSPTAS